MSSTLDPAKLKVVELRAELSKRGLDSKGNKPALVKRLKEALEKELKQEIPDTSIADTSTEDLDTSISQEQPPVEEAKPPEKDVKPPEEKAPEQVQTEEKMEVTEQAQPPESKVEQADEVEQQPQKQESEVNFETDQQQQQIEAKKPEENKENGEQNEDQSQMETAEIKENDEPAENSEEKSNETPKTEEQTSEVKGEKRKHSSPSPDRSQRRRSKSPIKDDEPPIDNNKVQLSWYDSDLHLQLDKESFLSAKPYHEGAFGFAWAGVRATHGVNFGKVCFEVKITEELKFEDFSKYYDKHRRDQHKPFSKHKSDEEKKKPEDEQKDENKKPEDQPTDENKKPEDEPKEEEKKEESEHPENGDNQSETVEPEKTEENKEETEKQEEAMETDECKKPEESEETENKEQAEPIPTHLFRVGWSLLDTALQLGEDKFSYGYESSGKFVSEKSFREYGITFGVGDVIGSFLNIDEENITITYSVNGVSQSEAIAIPKSEMPENFAFFPHVLSRNYAFELNLGSKEEAWFPKPEDFEAFEFLDKVESKVPGPVRPENRSDCEVILMCGLPASGKTHWVQEYVRANRDKKYTLLGNTHLLEKMTISGDALKSKYKGSWNMLLDKLQKCLNKLIEIAALRRRNYIIDQTNVFPSAQRRKLRPFEGFKRRAVVVVVGDEEQAKRQSLQEAQDGKDVPDSAVLEMKANMSLPQKGEWLDEVIYAEMGEEEAKAMVQKYNTQGREAGYGIQRRFSHRDDRHRWQNRRNDHRGGNYRDRNYHNNRYDRGPPRQGNWYPQQRPWNRDRRDNRGPPMGGSRDWRNRGRDRGNRDQGNNYNRNRNQPGRGPSGNWQSGGGGGGGWGQNQGGWGGSQAWGGQGSWGQQGSWSNQNQNQWKYGGGQGYGNYSNWGYYGQYPQNWNAQGQTHSASNAAANPNQFGQYSQQEWAQYAQQYVQQGQNTSGTGTNPSVTQK